MTTEEKAKELVNFFYLLRHETMSKKKRLRHW